MENTKNTPATDYVAPKCKEFTVTLKQNLLEMSNTETFSRSEGGEFDS